MPSIVIAIIGAGLMVDMTEWSFVFSNLGFQVFSILGIWRLWWMFFLVPDIAKYQDRPDCPYNYERHKPSVFINEIK